MFLQIYFYVCWNHGLKYAGLLEHVHGCSESLRTTNRVISPSLLITLILFSDFCQAVFRRVAPTNFICN